MVLPDRVDRPGDDKFSSAERLGICLRDEMASQPDFWFFSPDETTSNKLSAIYEASDRAWTGELKPWDKYMARDGRVVELLSENVLFGMMAGHVLAGGRGAMTSYEAFFTIVASQLDQYMKFIKQAKEVEWREGVHALNLISTSTCWRQDHNGYSHQSPALISALLDKPSGVANCLFPVDDVAAVAAWEYMREGRDVVNLLTLNKTEEPRWIDAGHARWQLREGQGASVFGFASDEEPDVVMCGAGDIVSREALQAVRLVKRYMPELRVRYVGIGALSYGAIGTCDNQMGQGRFDELFGRDVPIVANFHGYAGALRGVLQNYADRGRLHVHGFAEEGSTTTPMDMLTRNGASRYDLAADVFRLRGREDLVEEMMGLVAENVEYAKVHGVDKPVAGS